MLFKMLKSTGPILCRVRLKKYAWFKCCRESRSFASGSEYTKQKGIELSDFPVENIRNFSIIAHVDHGKSTLADRLLELSGTISVSADNKQVLDKLQVERERGITVKAQTATLFYRHNGTEYMLNLIDTPGHVDFNYEVSRSLAACQGVILLVDANQGIQAQTMANFYLAFEAELVILPVMNKIDLKGAKPDEVQEQIQTVFDFKPEEIHRISAKHGTGVEDLMKSVIEKLPAPNGDINKPSKALIFDSWFDKFRGAGCNIALLDGKLKKGDKVQLVHTGKTHEIQDLGIMYPNEYPTEVLYAGQVGYMYAQLKSTEDAQVGDTVHLEKSPVEALPDFKPAVPMVFAGFFPSDQSGYGMLRTAMQKLTLNDSSVQVNVDSSAALGQGWRLGFLGLLHMDVFMQRLEQEHNTSVIVTSPNVPYKVKIRQNSVNQYGRELTILNPCHMPPSEAVEEFHEPMVMGTIIAPDTYMSNIMSLIMDRRGEQQEQTYIDNTRLMFKVIFPLNEIVLDFFDVLKSLSSGYASFDYEDYGYRQSSLVRIDIALNGKVVDELTQIAHANKAREFARHLVYKLKECIPPQLFLIAIQAKVGKKVLAREDIKALRKDVLAKCYGGDVTRKTKLLRQQAEGKKKMRLIGNVSVPKDAFIKIMKR